MNSVAAALITLLPPDTGSNPNLLNLFWAAWPGLDGGSAVLQLTPVNGAPVMLGIDPNRVTGIGLTRDQIIPPDVAPGIPADFAASAFEHDDFFYAVTASILQSLIDGMLKRHLLPTPELAVTGNDDTCAGTMNAFYEAFG